MQQHLGHADALAKALGELADRFADDRGELAHVDHGRDSLARILRRQATGVGKELEQAARSHIGIERTVFRQVAQMLGGVDPMSRHVEAGDPR